MTGLSVGLTEKNIERLDKLDSNKDNIALKKNQDMGKDAFLKLMMTQLAHQDPLSPLDNKEMIQQMAQFSSVEQLGAMNQNMVAANNKSDSILEVLTKMQSSNSTIDTNSKMDDLLDKTDKTNEWNIRILNELMTLNKALGAYEIPSEPEESTDSTESTENE